MIYPKFLQKNGKIGFIAPSFGCATEPYRSAFDSALEAFEKRGHSKLIGPNAYAGTGIGISNTPEKCGEEVNWAFESNADAIISCGGGELMCEILPYIDFDRIKKSSPKWFMGYSDNTNLTFLLTTICDMAAIYGPCASSFGQKPWHASIADAYSLLKGEKLTFTGYDKWEKETLKTPDNPYVSYNTTEPSHVRGYVDGKISTVTRMSGRLLGGCLDCLVMLSGTRFDKVCEFNRKYSDDKIVWFLESCELGVFDVRRALWNLKQAGWFETAAGFVIGRPMRYDDEAMGLDMTAAYIDALSDLKVPIILDADLGHLPPQIPFVNGAIADISLRDNGFAISYEMR